LVTAFFPLPSVSYFSASKYGMHFSSIHYGESDESTSVTSAAVPELVGVQPAGLAMLTGQQWHHSAQPSSSTGTLPPSAALHPAAGHTAMTVLSPLGNSHRVSLLPCCSPNQLPDAAHNHSDCASRS